MLDVEADNFQDHSHVDNGLNTTLPVLREATTHSARSTDPGLVQLGQGAAMAVSSGTTRALLQG